MLVVMSLGTTAHDVYFCGEKIPIDDRLVADKLMNILKRQINYVNVPSLRQRVNQYFTMVEYFLKATGIPEDFKYLAIVESGFKNAVSSAGAAGFWQLMPGTAREWGLTVIDGGLDERNDFNKSTHAACKVLANYYLYIRKTFGISSWVLTAAAYNNGIGNIKNAISKQGKNYFRMNLNPETAAYVYKIIAVKELFEYPELYMKNFGYNIFSTQPTSKNKKANDGQDSDISDFSSMKVDINEADGQHPETVKQGNIKNKGKEEVPVKVKFVSAKVTGKYKNFKDGDIISLKLEDDLQVLNRFTGKGSIIQGKAWIIDERVMVDLGYDHSVTLFDLTSEKGISLPRLKSKEPVILKVTEPIN